MSFCRYNVLQKIINSLYLGEYTQNSKFCPKATKKVATKNYQH